MHVIRAEDSDYEAAQSLMLKSLAQGCSFVDCISMTIAKRLRMRAIVTGDRRFNTTGFETLL
jgi:predicted nucleic acid-binding protein